MKHTINFRKAFGFAPLVESGEKDQTLRPRRKRPIKVGDTLRLYTGQRTAACRFLREERCTNLIPVRRMGHLRWRRGNHELSVSEMREIALRDGFKTVEDFDKFFGKRYGDGARLDVIRWRRP